MSTNLGKPLRLRNDGGAQLQLERSGTTRSLTVNTSGNVELDGTLIPTALTTASATITGGSINGTTIGATTASAGAFTTITGSGNMNIDSGTLFVDAANDRVGIGTTTPASYANDAKLVIQTASSTGGIVATFANSGSTGAGIQFFQNGVDVFNVGMPAGTAGLAFSAGTTERMRIDSAGNLGLGVTPSAWATGTRAIDVGSGSALFNPGSGTQTWLMTNSFNDGTNFVYKNNGGAGYYQQNGNIHAWHNAPAGTAGNAISFTQAMTLDASGNLGVAGLVSAEVSVNSVQSFSFRNSSTGGSAIARLRVGNDRTPNALTVDVLGENTATPNLVNIINQNTAAMAFGTDGAERMRIATSGELLTGGKTTVTANGGDVQVSSGISFPATQVAKSDPNTLDDYEEGTWTPTVGGTWSTNPTTLTSGYIKTGSSVTIWALFDNGAKASAISGWLESLPFPVSGEATGACVDTDIVNRGLALVANTNRVWLTNNSFSVGRNIVTATYQV
jgi:hypothetical protein